MNELEWIIARSRLYQLIADHPTWTQEQYASELGYSRKWVGKWVKRFAAREAEGVTAGIFASQSREPKERKKKVSAEMEQLIVTLRLTPHQGIRWVAGPRTIITMLGQDARAKGCYIPQSTRTVWEVLRKHNCIASREKKKRQPEERPEPMTTWDIDFKTVLYHKQEEGGHYVAETLNVLDRGTSIWVDGVTQDNYRAETVLDNLLDIFTEHGLPRQLRFDRDPRFVGSWSAKEFPSPMMQFLLALAIDPITCPPQRPDKNGFVERLNRTYKEECLLRDRPLTVEQAQEATDRFRDEYNHLRPNQALSCLDQPPRRAFPDAQSDRKLPKQVNPDSWVSYAARRPYTRRVNASGSIRLGNQSYYVSAKLRRQTVRITVAVDTLELLIYNHDNQLVKRCPIKGLWHGQVSLETYFTAIREDAISDARRLATRRRQQRRNNRR